MRETGRSGDGLGPGKISSNLDKELPICNYRHVRLTTRKVAELAGVHRDTLLRWLREGKVPEPDRDRNNYRVFTAAEAQAITAYASSDRTASVLGEATVPYGDRVSGLHKLDWGFREARTGYLTHSLHPYPAKFIPQIPNSLIQELSSVG